MVPFHDSDVGEQRWAKEGWDRVELWEKIEQSQKRQRRYWILGTVVVFLLLSTIPVWMDRHSKWQANRMARHLAQTVAKIKTQAAMTQKAVRLRVLNDPAPMAVVEQGASCQSSHFEKTEELTDWGISAEAAAQFAFVTQEVAKKFDLPGLQSEFCFDPFSGEKTLGNFDAPGIGIIASKDLAEGRIDKMAVLFWKGDSAELSFE